jgi:CRISPR-associated protein Csy3
MKTASVLAFERKLDPSDALFYAGNWDRKDDANTWAPIAIREKYVRGTISNRLSKKESDPAKLDAQIEKPNLQSVDVATMPVDSDTLLVNFTLKILGGVGTPSACNNSEYQARLCEVVQSYTEGTGFGELARRYAVCLANARFLWRNRLGSEAVQVRISHVEDGEAKTSWEFDSLTFSLRDFEVPQGAAGGIEELSAVVKDGFSGGKPVILNVQAFARVGAGQEVFPSQELSLERGKGDKSKTLYHVEGVAGMHSQKIGNALRTIDDWHPLAEEVGPIAVEPYGSVTTIGRACRQPKMGVDFYSLLDKWVCKDKAPDTEGQHFVMATLIRGGVFGEKDS